MTVTAGSGGIVVVGSLNRDLVFRVDRLPAAGETRLGSQTELFCGGKGGNQAVAAALLGTAAGVPVAMVGAVGDDPDGAALLAGLRDAGVDVADVATRRGGRSGTALITVAADGDNTIVVAPGANATVEVGEVRAALRRRRPAVVVTQGEVPPPVVEATIREAATVGARPVLNLAPVVEVDAAVLELCDPLVVNGPEAALLVGRRVADAADLEEAAAELARRARSAVVTAGAAGAWVGTAGGVRHVPARPATVVDSTGAGDAFTGALAVGLALGEDLVTAAGWGSVVAARAVGGAGAQASFPGGAEVGLGRSEGGA